MKRFKAQKKEKMTELVARSNAGQLSSFAGVFQVTPLSAKEQTSLRALLEKYQTEEVDLACDLPELTTLTSEVKAISNQAVILHGERLKKIQELLKSYREGAFSEYLLYIYGNRQTPYNFLLYYDFFSKISKEHQHIVCEMPRQVIYTLSSRKVPMQEKEAFVAQYKGETKNELLKKLRALFPLPLQDKRSTRPAKAVLDLLRKANHVIRKEQAIFSARETKEVHLLLTQLKETLRLHS